MKSKSGREIVGYVIREGKERGKGRYVGHKPAVPDYKESRRYAFVYHERPVGLRCWGRVVALVKPAAPRLVATEEDARRAHMAHWGDMSDFEANPEGVKSHWISIAQAVLDGRAKELARMSKLGSVGEPAKDAGSASDVKGVGGGMPAVRGSPVPSHADAGTFSEELVERIAEACSAKDWRTAARTILSLLPKSEHHRWLSYEMYLTSIRERDIARADLQRMTESRDALREQAKGLAEKLDAVRKAAG
jgi:hypothetical protein